MWKPASFGSVYGGRGVIGDLGLDVPCSPPMAVSSYNNTDKEWAAVAVGSSMDATTTAGVVAKRPELGAGGEGDEVGVLQWRAR